MTRAARRFDRQRTPVGRIIALRRPVRDAQTLDAAVRAAAVENEKARDARPDMYIVTTVALVVGLPGPSRCGLTTRRYARRALLSWTPGAWCREHGAPCPSDRTRAACGRAMVRESWSSRSRLRRIRRRSRQASPNRLPASGSDSSRSWRLSSRDGASHSQRRNVRTGDCTAVETSSAPHYRLLPLFRGLPGSRGPLVCRPRCGAAPS